MAVVSGGSGAVNGGAGTTSLLGATDRPAIHKGFTASVLSGGLGLDVLPDGETLSLSFTLPFPLPLSLIGKSFFILWFDPTLNGGLGGWVELPLVLLPGGLPVVLHPGPPPLFVSAPVTVSADGLHVTLTLNFTGTFMLIAR